MAIGDYFPFVAGEIVTADQWNELLSSVIGPWKKVSKSYTDFQVGAEEGSAVSPSIPLVTLPAGSILEAVVVVVSTGFASDVAVGIEVQSEESTTLDAVIATTGSKVIPYPVDKVELSTSKDITIRIAADCNILSLTAGQVDVYYKISSLV